MKEYYVNWQILFIFCLLILFVIAALSHSTCRGLLKQEVFMALLRQNIWERTDLQSHAPRFHFRMEHKTCLMFFFKHAFFLGWGGGCP